MLDNLQSIGENIHDKTVFQMPEFLLFCLSSINDTWYTCVFDVTIQHILAIKRFDAPLTNSWIIWKTQILNTYVNTTVSNKSPNKI